MEESISTKIKELRLICERTNPIQPTNSILLFREYLESTTKLTSQPVSQSQVNLGQLKVQLREVEDDLVKALSVKTRKEAKHITICDSISAIKADIEELKKSLHDQKERKDEYASIITQQSLALAALEEKVNQKIKDNKDTQDVLSWYNRVLGLRIEGGRGGVKVIFNNINLKDLSEEYFFTVQLAHNTYTLLKCNPQLDGTKELINKLNHTNDFFKFVRIMRTEFQAAASMGSYPQPIFTQPDSSAISISAPMSPISLDGNSSGTLEKEHTPQAQGEDVSKTLKYTRRHKSPGSRDMSPGSASSSRRSSRLKVSHQEVSPESSGRSSGSGSRIRHSSRLKANKVSN